MVVQLDRHEVIDEVRRVFDRYGVSWSEGNEASISFDRLPEVVAVRRGMTRDGYMRATRCQAMYDAYLVLHSRTWEWVRQRCPHAEMFCETCGGKNSILVDKRHEEIFKAMTPADEWSEFQSWNHSQKQKASSRAANRTARGLPPQSRRAKVIDLAGQVRDELISAGVILLRPQSAREVGRDQT